MSFAKPYPDDCLEGTELAAQLLMRANQDKALVDALVARPELLKRFQVALMQAGVHVEQLAGKLRR